MVFNRGPCFFVQKIVRNFFKNFGENYFIINLPYKIPGYKKEYCLDSTLLFEFYYLIPNVVKEVDKVLAVVVLTLVFFFSYTYSVFRQRNL